MARCPSRLASRLRVNTASRVKIRGYERSRPTLKKLKRDSLACKRCSASVEIKREALG
jgi:hypothetical protein